MRVTLHLDDDDLLRFREALARAGERAACADPGDIIDGARYALDHLEIASAPGYVRSRILEVGRLIRMLEDEDWQMSSPFQTAVLRALAYFADPDDLVPDDIGVIGLLDDAILLDILLRELRGMLRAYDEFATWRELRETGAGDADSSSRIEQARETAKQRKRLQARLRPPRNPVAAAPKSSAG